MSLSDISLASLRKILEFMSKDPRNVDSLRQTCKLFNQEAVALGLHKLDGAFIRLAIESRRFHFHDNKMGKDCVIRATIKMKKLANDPDCFVCCRDNGLLRSRYTHNSDSDTPSVPLRDIYEDVTDSDGSGKEETYKIGSNRRHKRYPEHPDDERSGESETESEAEEESDTDTDSGSDSYNYYDEDFYCSCKTWFVIAVQCWRISRQKQFTEVFARLLKRVNSIDKLKIKCYRINDDGLIFLNQLPQLSCLRKLVLFNCHLHVQKENFHGFLRSPFLTEVMLSCKFTKYRLEDEFLSNMYRVQIVGVFGKKQRFFNGLTDSLLSLWRDRPPTYCNMRGFDTKFTIVGIVKLMRRLLKTLYNFKYVLSLVSMDREGYGKLFKFSQCKRSISWTFVKKRLDGTMCVTAVFPNGSDFVIEIQMLKEEIQE